MQSIPDRSYFTYDTLNLPMTPRIVRGRGTKRSDDYDDDNDHQH